MRVLVVEDDAISRSIIAAAVERLGHEVRQAAGGTDAWEVFQKESFEVVISDWFMPTLDGLELCRRIRAHDKEAYTYFLLVTVAAGYANALKAMEEGADDFLTKPLDPDELAVRLVAAERLTQLRAKVHEAQTRLSVLEEQSTKRGSFSGMIGKSPAMQRVFSHLRMAAQSNVSVHVQGESGTGKELAARALHSLSARKNAPFLGINCAAIPEGILDSELFGHVRGAFTGATRDRLGLFELADRGTLFLDEIGDIPLALQKKLLRVLEERTIWRVGDTRARAVDVRIVTATHQDLKSLVERQVFREDLYYRIRVFQIDLPRLAERREDLMPLVDHFMSHFREETGKRITQLSPGALRALMEHDWRGNIRELRNAMEYGFVVARPPELGRDDLPPELRGVESSTDPVSAAPPPTSMPTGTRKPDISRPVPTARVDSTAAREVIAAVQASSGNRAEAARRLGISRVALWKRIRKFELDSVLPPSRRGGKS